MSIAAYLERHRVHFQAILHPPAISAAHRAGILHTPGRQVAKSVLVRDREKFLLAVLPATHRIDVSRLMQILASTNVRLATEDEVLATFAECECGALPSFGRPFGVSTLLDASLTGARDLLLVGDRRHESYRMTVKDYESLEHPLRARFANPVHGNRADSNRRAG